MESLINLNSRVLIKNLVMLAAFEIVPGVKSTLFSISALPAEPIHVPLLSLINNEIPGRALPRYFSSRAFNAAFFGWWLLLSVHGQGSPMERVCSICAFLHELTDAITRMTMIIIFMSIE